MASRRYSIGAETMADGGCNFRVWAPKCKHVEVVLKAAGGNARIHAMNAEPRGYFSAVVSDAPPGSLYQFRLNGDSQLYPDPTSRFQPDGPHGPSQIVQPHSFAWTDHGWPGLPRHGQVLYEMHVGTFTSEGTWRAAQRELARLADVGITTVQVMPVADFPGKFGWGYDGVNFFAPTRLYGVPDDFRGFVNAAHALKLGVILDIVYNHFGADGNYLRQFSDEYFTDRYKNEWGDAINFDGPEAGPVREYFLTNIAYWIDEFHLDGFRLDATQQIFDASPTHILAEIARTARSTAPQRRKFIVAENERQEARLARAPEIGGYGLDAIFNDDLHHSAIVALTGRTDAYYHDHAGTPQEFISAAKWGFLFQGQRYAWQKNRRGYAALDLEPTNYVNFIDNHDQVANSSRGLRARALTSPGRYRAMTAYMLLGPATPLLFQGQEFGATNPFHFFADHHPELAKLVLKGRRGFMAQFANMVEFGLLENLPAPHDPGTFERCKLQPAERDAHPEIVALHRDLLRLRREDPAFQSPRRHGVDGAVLGPDAFVLRFFVPGGADRLLLVNLGRYVSMRIAPEPLLAPPEEMTWTLVWSSEAWSYGGSGHRPLEDDDDHWRIPGEAAVVLAATKGV